MEFNVNQFKQGVAVGSLDLTNGGISSAMAVCLDPDSATTTKIEAGTPLKFVQGGASTAHSNYPLVDVAKAGDVAIGASIFSLHSGGTSKPGDLLEVSFRGCIQRLTAGGALIRGAEVSFDPANLGKVVALNGARFGFALDNAASDGDDIRVIIDPAKA